MSFQCWFSYSSKLFYLFLCIKLNSVHTILATISSGHDTDHILSSLIPTNHTFIKMMGTIFCVLIYLILTGALLYYKLTPWLHLSISNHLLYITAPFSSSSCYCQYVTPAFIIKQETISYTQIPFLITGQVQNAYNHSTPYSTCCKYKYINDSKIAD